MFDVLKETGKDVREIAADLAFSISLSLPHYEAWKATFPAAEWPNEFNRLLARLSGQYSLQAEILEHEREFDLGFFIRSFRVVRVGLLGLGLETAHCYASYDLLCLGHLLAYLLIMADII